MCMVFMESKEDANIVAKNYDCFVDGAYIFTNKRGIQRKSLVMPPVKEMHWTSIYGSITFSQSGKGMPCNGINEKGLVVEQASLPNTKYSEKSGNGTVSCLEAIQYILDKFANVQEAIKGFEEFNISNQSGWLHYFLADKTGDRAIVEFIDGQMNVYQEKEMLLLITNSRYESLCKDMPDNDTEYEQDSFNRFRIVKTELEKTRIGTAQEAFDLLSLGKRKDTAWSVVYELNKDKIWFRNAKNKIHCIMLKEVDFCESAPSFLYDIDSNTNEFCWEAYSRERNRQNIEHFYKNPIALQALHLSNSDFLINAFDEHINQIETGSN